MKHRMFLTGIVTLAMGVTAVSAVAQGPGAGHGGKAPSFSELDTDGSGEITREEMQAQHRARFEAGDTDGDGKLSQAELEARAQAQVADRVARMLARMDDDGDGALSFEEMQPGNRAIRAFQRIDTDDSGGISEQELAEMRERRAARGHRAPEQN